MLALNPGIVAKSFSGATLSNGLAGLPFALPSVTAQGAQGLDIRWQQKPRNGTCTAINIKLQGSLGDPTQPDTPNNWLWYDLDASTNVAGESKLVQDEKSLFVRAYVLNFVGADLIDVNLLV